MTTSLRTFLKTTTQSNKHQCSKQKRKISDSFRSLLLQRGQKTLSKIWNHSSRRLILRKDLSIWEQAKQRYLKQGFLIIKRKVFWLRTHLSNCPENFKMRRNRMKWSMTPQLEQILRHINKKCFIKSKLNQVILMKTLNPQMRMFFSQLNSHI